MNIAETLLKATCQCLEQARRAFPQHKIRDVQVRCDLGGTQAGQYHANERLIRYNLQIASRQWQHFVQRTVVHEVAHHVVDEIWGQGQRSIFKGLKIQPHGVQWREVMRALGAEDISRCHSYNLDGMQVKRQKRYPYHCDCREHSISATRHNRILAGLSYQCTRCHQSLKRLKQPCVE